jgi:hypothetical protein
MIETNENVFLTQIVADVTQMFADILDDKSAGICV